MPVSAVSFSAARAALIKSRLRSSRSVCSVRASIIKACGVLPAAFAAELMRALRGSGNFRVVAVVAMALLLQKVIQRYHPVRLASIHWYQQGMRVPHVDEFAWLMQELRVSLFAQELKTPVIVSVKRLEKMLAGIRS